MPPKKKSRAQGKSGKSGKEASAHRLKLLLAALLLSGFLLLCLVFLAHQRQSSRPAPPLAPSVAPVAAPAPLTILEDVRVEIESTLLRSGVSLAEVETRQEGRLTRYEVRGAFPTAALLDELAGRLTRIEADLRLETQSAEARVLVSQGGEAVALLHFYQPLTPSPVHPTKSGARVAIIMDDLGRDVETAKALLAIDLPVTFAILPGEGHAPEVATLAYRGGREVLIHIPMEPQSYPATNPGADALLLGQTPEEIRRRFQGFVERVPHAVGGNNHMGSRFTEYREGMDVVLAAMKEAGLFFVDSRTTGRSVAFAAARAAGVPAAARDVFLDNDQDVERISGEIRKLAVLAGKRGQAVGICHPYAQTLEALRRQTAYLKQQNVEVVPISELLSR